VHTIAAIKDAGLKSAIIIAFNTKKPTVEGRTEILWGSIETKGLLEVAEETGIEKTLIDVTDVTDPGPAVKAIYLVKKEFGLPAGSGANNAMETWLRRKKLDSTTYLASNAVAQSIPIMMGG